MALWLSDLKKLREIGLLFMGTLSIHFMLFLFDVGEDILLGSFFIIIMGMILVVAMTNFEYLHDKTKATHIASLPITKSKLFLIRYCSGLFVIVIPIIIYSILTIATLGYCIPMLPILLLIGIYYSVACLVGVLAGTAIMHGFLYFIVIIMPLLVYVSLSAMFIVFIKGIEEIYLLNSILTYTVPLLRVWDACKVLPLSFSIVFTYIAYIGIAIGIGCFISNKRHLEYTGTAFAFPMLGNLLKSVIVLCFSWIITAVLILGIYNLILILLIYFIVTLLLSIVTQLQRKKSIDIRFITMQTIVIYLFSLFVFITSSSILTDYIPSTVASAWLDIRPVDLNIEGCYDEVIDINGITEIQDIHQYLITNTHKEKHNNEANPIDIKYTLTNGDVINRSYYVSEKIYQNMIQRIVESDALYTSYMSKYYNFLDVLSEVQSMTLYNTNHTTDISYRELNQDEIIQFQNQLKEELRKNKSVDIRPSNNSYSMDLVDDRDFMKVFVTIDGPLIRVIESYFD